LLVHVDISGTTFVLEEIAHLGWTGKDELTDIFDDFGFFFGRQRCEPLCETDFSLTRD